VSSPALCAGGAGLLTHPAHRKAERLTSNATKRSKAKARARHADGHARTRSANPSADRTATRSILWASNAPWTATGYGEQTQQVVTRIAEEGHRIAVAANYGLEGTRFDWQGIPIFPRGLDGYSNDVIPAYAMDFGKETGRQPLVVTLFDCWVFKGAGWPLLDTIASWVPVDHFPVPDAVADWLRKDNVTPIAMSKFGRDAIERLDIETRYIPHAIDTTVFRPTELLQGTEGAVPARRWMGVPDDAFVIGMVSANKGSVDRKSFAESFIAAGLLMSRHDDVWLYLHTEPSRAMQGLDLRKLLGACSVPMDRVKFVDSYSYRMGIPKEALASIYTGMDVLLQPSRGEGFGIPAIEAQACGTRVIVSDATAQAELCGDGWKVDVQPAWDDPQGAWLFTPIVSSIVDSLEAAYARGQGRSQAAIDFASHYDADKVFEEMWTPLLAELTQ
jgi:glycosyltransferase involved in cell wall biosynthesis